MYRLKAYKSDKVHFIVKKDNIIFNLYALTYNKFKFQKKVQPFDWTLIYHNLVIIFCRTFYT